jgi:hypothetical protein
MIQLQNDKEICRCCEPLAADSEKDKRRMMERGEEKREIIYKNVTRRQQT